MALLDGQRVPDGVIDPAKHRYIGSFRTPQPPDTKMANGEYAAVMICRCSDYLWSVQAIFDHWQRGHMDIPQYVSIEKVNEL